MFCFLPSWRKNVADVQFPELINTNDVILFLSAPWSLKFGCKIWCSDLVVCSARVLRWTRRLWRSVGVCLLPHRDDVLRSEFGGFRCWFGASQGVTESTESIQRHRGTLRRGRQYIILPLQSHIFSPNFKDSRRRGGSLAKEEEKEERKK